jgi:hypothetical protein
VEIHAPRFFARRVPDEFAANESNASVAAAFRISSSAFDCNFMPGPPIFSASSSEFALETAAIPLETRARKTKRQEIPLDFKPPSH